LASVTAGSSSASRIMSILPGAMSILSIVHRAQIYVGGPLAIALSAAAILFAS